METTSSSSLNKPLRAATFSPLLENLLLSLPLLRYSHAPGSQIHTLLKLIARQEAETLFSQRNHRVVNFAPFGELLFPYHKMGAVDTLNLFDIDELIIFSFYWLNRKRYRRVLDVGANLGLHSLLLSRAGYEVSAYEPDPEHFKRLKRNLELNHCETVQAFETAVGSKAGTAEFIRVLGNTTGSHIAGSKANPYGDLEKFPVKVMAIEPLIREADLMKLDVEGYEKEVLLSTSTDHWLKTDALVEVGNENNAHDIYHHFRSLGVNLFAQKINWQKVTTLENMPTSYHDGSLFVSTKAEMPWEI